MPTKLKPLLLPRIVQARKSEENKESEASSPDLAASFHTQNSTASDIPSPVTPTFSVRGHSRYASSSTSSVDASFSTFAKASPSSSPYADSIDTFSPTVRPLPGVQEETLEKDECYDMFDDSNDGYGFLGRERVKRHPPSLVPRSSLVMPAASDYDFANDFLSDTDAFTNAFVRKQRAAESPLTGFATRFGTRFPSFSKRWKGRKNSNASMVDGSFESTPSIPGSSRASSLTRSLMETADAKELHYPLTPARSILEGDDDDVPPMPGTIDVATANTHEDGTQSLATTPLLPPLMIADSVSSAQQQSIQSPLQSPTVAQTPEGMSQARTPAEDPSAIQPSGMPSPPLSAKPSLASVHNQTSGLTPANEIPSFRLAGPDDQWADRLGHANFDIHPEPYVPDVFDVEACRQIRANWDLARTNYTKHLVRTGEHYGVTSKTYRLTEEKWSEINSQWKEHNDLALSKTSETGHDTTGLQEAPEQAPRLMKIPSLNDPRSDGKFPKLGDEVIVGPMVQIASQLQRKPSRKAAILKFFHDVKFPGVGCLGRSRSRTT
ncbi:MAG: hypothetical protein M1817_003920 [Caeruleum heppii]|nr:MAG: hypothetical protein M1817_003920 [Caeruleum heppii]